MDSKARAYHRKREAERAKNHQAEMTTISRLTEQLRKAFPSTDRRLAVLEAVKALIR